MLPSLLIVAIMEEKIDGREKYCGIARRNAVARNIDSIEN